MTDETAFRKWHPMTMNKVYQQIFIHQIECTYIYILTYEKWIHPNNCSYFTFDHPDTYRLILITQRDNADLQYISTYHKYVS